MVWVGKGLEAHSWRLLEMGQDSELIWSLSNIKNHLLPAVLVDFPFEQSCCHLPQAATTSKEWQSAIPSSQKRGNNWDGAKSPRLSSSCHVQAAESPSWPISIGKFIYFYLRPLISALLQQGWNWKVREKNLGQGRKNKKTTCPCVVLLLSG